MGRKSLVLDSRKGRKKMGFGLHNVRKIKKNVKSSECTLCTLGSKIITLAKEEKILKSIDFIIYIT